MSRGNLRGVYHVRRKFKRGISLLYHGCYRSNHGINIYMCLSWAKMRKQNYVAKQKRNVHLEMRNLKQGKKC